MLFYGMKNGQIDLVGSATKVFTIGDIYARIVFETSENSETNSGANRRTV